MYTILHMYIYINKSPGKRPAGACVVNNPNMTFA